MKISVRNIVIGVSLFALLLIGGTIFIRKRHTEPKRNADETKTPTAQTVHRENELTVDLDSAAQKRMGIEMEKAGGNGPAVLAPVSAIVWEDGSAWIYVQEGDSRFVRKKVIPLKIQRDKLMEVEGIKTGTSVVSNGAQILLSKELSSRFQTEDGD